MNSNELAKRILEFLGGLDNWLEDLKQTVLDQIAILYRQAVTLGDDILESESKFYDTIAEMILILKKPPKLFKPFFKWVIKRFLKLAMEKLVGPDWASQIRNRSHGVVIANNRITVRRDIA